MTPADSILQILKATANHIADQEGHDPEALILEHRVSHINVRIKPPRTPRWDLSMSPAVDFFQKDISLDISLFEGVVRTLIRAVKAAQHVHERFGRDVPSWATAIHPLGRDVLEASSYHPWEMLKASRSPSWRPEEREEYLLGDKTGLHLEIKLLRVSRCFRSRGTFATFDVERLPESVRVAVIGKQVKELSGKNLQHSENLRITSAVDHDDAGATRLSLWGDLIPIGDLPEGETAWWIRDWSRLQDLRMDRPLN